MPLDLQEASRDGRTHVVAGWAASRGDLHHFAHVAQAESRGLRLGNEPQVLQCLGAVFPVTAGGAPGLEQQALTLVIPESVRPQAGQLSKLANAHNVEVSIKLRRPSSSDHWRQGPARGRLHVTSQGVRMARSSRSKSSRDKVRAHRARLRQQGLRPIQIWVPDVRSPAFATEAHRQSLAVANSPHAKANQDFIDAVSHWGME